MKVLAWTKRQNNVVAALFGPCLSMALAALGTSTAAVTLPELSFEFQSSSIDPTLVVAVYILATTALIVPVGRAGDLFGKRTVLACGLTLYVLGAILAFHANTLPVLVIGRFVQGAGAAAMMAMPLALVRDNISSDQVGRWMGVMGTMSAIGTASGPAIGGMIVASFGWRYVYLMQIPVAMFALAFCLIHVQNRKHADNAKGIDLVGAFLLALFLACLALFVSGLKNGFDPSSATCLVVAIAAIWAFVHFEIRTATPIIPFKLLRSKQLRTSVAMNAIISMVMMGILVVGPFFLVEGLGLTTAQMGLAMSVGPISAALSGIPAGRLTEKTGTGRTVVVGASAMVVATATMAGLPVLFGLSGFIVAFMLLAPGYQVFLAALNTSVMEGSSEQDRGVTSGVLNLSRNFGFTLGAGLISSLFWSLAGSGSGTGNGSQMIGIAMAGTFSTCCAMALFVTMLAVISNRYESSD